MPSGVYVRTKEARNNIGLAKLGNKNSLGHKCSEETKREMSKNHNPKSNPFWSEERKQNHRNIFANKKKLGYVPIIAGWWKDKNFSKGHKEKIGKALIGNKNNLGNHRSEEAKRKTSKKLKGRISPRKGAILSKETKRKISESNKRRLLENPEYLKKILRRRTPTSLEKSFQEIIDKNNLSYKYVGDGSFIVGKKNPDFINTNNKKIAIEVYARYHKLKHNETIEEWKEERSKMFREYGWKIMYFDEEELTEQNVLNKIKKEA